MPQSTLADSGHDPPPRSLAAARALARNCTRCDLWRLGTQTVFGEGRRHARLMLVGEQPGDQEDLAGKPFVGPAGKLLDEALQGAGVDRAQAYVTNAVKHFKNEPRGKRRIHQKPNAGEVQACKWWLDLELALIRPRLAVALGATAARALLGRPIAVMSARGRVFERGDGVPVFVTIHPSALLRMPDPQERRAARARFAEDLRKAAALAA